MNIPEIIKEHHQMMVDKGFYDCPECLGTAREIKSEDYQCLICQSFKDRDFNECIECIPLSCSHCDGSGINPNKNIGELLMLIVTELSAALEAHRTNRFSITANEGLKNVIEEFPGYIDYYNKNIKDTFEDEIADVFLRLFDLCGYLGIDPSPSIPDSFKYNIDNVGEIILNIAHEVWSIKTYGLIEYNFSRSIYFLWCAAVNNWDIPIEKYILAKMAYNKTRPHKHGKEY